MSNEIVDESDRHRLVTRRNDLEAELVYRLDGTRLTLEHTEVPEALGGQGIGGALVQAAVDRARSQGETIVPSCPYARRWLEKHPEQATTVAVDWSTDS